MIRTALGLCFLNLAVAASAQTVVLSPVAMGGLRRYVRYGAHSSITERLTGALETYFRSDLMTNTPSGHYIDTGRWRAEFDLSGVPARTRIVSAILTTRVTRVWNPYGISPSPETINLATYVGTGTIGFDSSLRSTGTRFNAGSGTVAALDVTKAVRESPGRYLGFDLSTQGSRYTFGSTLTWAAPTLTLTYAPTPVPEPATLAGLGLGETGLFHRHRAGRA